ncbi:hypothetical protein KOI35_26915 [Actinoplanes bogorensis]|uniref:Uncharacterized protein n=1 Tax=Paractinoplanes bogorensis TaxID=1610840 RepID=A0ABS5YWQ9_9ACTN|nr:hypothetical protein [Actinoplanes bogorensis]MBU2667144.1 hypothetical protein [Actinoplanes bogorensis]
MTSKTDEDRFKKSGADSTYYVGTHDWPIGSVSGVPVDELIRVIGDFDEFYGPAVQSLAKTEVPAETT